MSYGIHVWLDDEAPGLKEMGEHLAETLSDGVDVEVSADKIVIREGDWRLEGVRNGEDWVAAEAEELTSFLDDLTDEQTAVLAEASARLEIEPFPEAKTDDYYNTWLAVGEGLAELSGVLVFFPSDASVLG